MSWNVFTNHDKTMLIGSSDTVGPDVGKLKVTLHHNVFDGVGQRAPRVRFGQVDLYNNYFKVDGSTYDYSVGHRHPVGRLHGEQLLPRGRDGIPLDQVLKDWKGTALTEIGSRAVNGERVSLLDAYNAVIDPDFGPDAGWTPALRHARATARRR